MGEGEPVEAISAVTLLVAEMGRSVHFYRALGLRLVYGGPSEAFSSFRAGSGYLNLQASEAAGWVPVAWGRVVMWVDDVDRMHARAMAAGLEAVAPPVDATWGERYFHILDPDGHELSFARPLPAG